jgi:tRNA (mo5U34)-methyltransferase
MPPTRGAREAAAARSRSRVYLDGFRSDERRRLVHYAAPMDAEAARRRIAEFPRWDYYFEFADGLSTPSDRGRINRQAQRHRYFFERLLELTGGSLEGRRVLDLGCNSGYWSLAAIDAGAQFVLGLDIDGDFVEQAKLVFELKGVDAARYRFERGDVLEQALERDFDVVLCLGLFDHVDRPAELFEAIAASGADLVVIDTEVSRASASLFEVSRRYHTRNLVGDGLVLIPSRRAISELAARHDYETVALELNADDFDGIGDYRRERRCAFICSRTLELQRLPIEKRSRTPWWIRDPRALTSI